MAKKTPILETVLYALTMAMGLAGVVVVVLVGQGIMEFSTDTILLILGIGVFCLGLAGLNKVT